MGYSTTLGQEGISVWLKPVAVPIGPELWLSGIINILSFIIICVVLLILFIVSLLITKSGALFLNLILSSSFTLIILYIKGLGPSVRPNKQLSTLEKNTLPKREQVPFPHKQA